MKIDAKRMKNRKWRRYYLDLISAPIATMLPRGATFARIGRGGIRGTYKAFLSEHPDYAPMRPDGVKKIPTSLSLRGCLTHLVRSHGIRGWKYEQGHSKFDFKVFDSTKPVIQILRLKK